MNSMKARIESDLRRFEQRIGIDREGRTVWVWLMPLGVGLISAALAPFMPGLPDATGWPERLALSIFALLTMTAIASIYLISFDNDHNQQAAVEDSPGQNDTGGSKAPTPPTGSPPPQWVSALDTTVEEEPVPEHAANHREDRSRVPTGAPR